MTLLAWDQKLKLHIEQIDRCSRPSPMPSVLNAGSFQTASDFEG